MQRIESGREYRARVAIVSSDAVLRFRGAVFRGGLGDELCERLGPQVLQDGSLTLQPGFMHGAGGVLSAGSILQYTSGNVEGSFDRFHRISQRDLFRRSCQA